MAFGELVIVTDDAGYSAAAAAPAVARAVAVAESLVEAGLEAEAEVGLVIQCGCCYCCCSQYQQCYWTCFDYLAVLNVNCGLYHGCGSLWVN